MKRVTVFLVVGLALAACGKKKDDAAAALGSAMGSAAGSAGSAVAAKLSFADRAKALAAKYSPKLADLSKHLPELADKAKDIPSSVPGAEKIQKLLADNKEHLASAQGVLAGLPEKLGAESPEQAEKDLADAEKKLQAETDAAEKDEKDEEAEIAAATKK